MDENYEPPSPSVELVKEQFVNARNMIEDVLESAHRSGLIDMETGRSWLDLFCHHSRTAEQIVMRSKMDFETDKGIASTAILNMVAIALVAGSREPNFAYNKFKQFKALGVVGAQSAKRRQSADLDEIVKAEYEHWLNTPSGHIRRKSNFIAEQILPSVNEKLTGSGRPPVGKDAIRKRLDKILDPDGLDN